jgi:hypothetical protein
MCEVDQKSALNDVGIWDCERAHIPLRINLTSLDFVITKHTQPDRGTQTDFASGPDLCIASNPATARCLESPVQISTRETNPYTRFQFVIEMNRITGVPDKPLDVQTIPSFEKPRRVNHQWRIFHAGQTIDRKNDTAFQCERLGKNLDRTGSRIAQVKPCAQSWSPVCGFDRHRENSLPHLLVEPVHKLRFFSTRSYREGKQQTPNGVEMLPIRSHKEPFS